MKPKSIELLAFDRDHNLQYEGKCKLRIDRLSEMLLVEPENEEYKMKSAMFIWNFLMDKNILFVFGEHELSDFALIFDEEDRCKKVYDFIVKEKEKNVFEKEMLFQRFLLPFCNRITRNDDTTLAMKKVLLKWIDKHDNIEKKKHIEFLKENNVFDLIFFTVQNSENGTEIANHSAFDKVTETDNAKKKCNLRKRRHSKIKNVNLNHTFDCKDDNETVAQLPIPCKKYKSLKIYSKTIDESQFKLGYVKRGRWLQRKLFVFTSIEKTNCYEYLWSQHRKIYYCKGCYVGKKDITAFLDINENGNECIKMEDKKHVCALIPYAIENFIETKTIKKPGYEILKNCHTASGIIVMIFSENDKHQCWEFRQCKFYKRFKCCHCKTWLKIWNENTEKEYVEFGNANHQCKYVPYEPQKYYQFNEFVVSPNFKIQNVFKNGKDRRRLIIFNSNDRNLCYVYSFCVINFICLGCIDKRQYVFAKLLKNSDGEDYVLLSPKKHVCELRPYSNVPKEKIILRPPDFELIEDTSNGVKKLFIFTESNNRNLCFEFSQRGKGDSYYCLGCEYIRRTAVKKDNATIGVYASLCKDKNGKLFLRINDRKHVCKPRKYEAEKHIETAKCYDFFFFRQKALPNSITVALYHSDNKNLCFRLNYSKSKSCFRCNKCEHKGKFITSKIEEDENGKEYFIHDHKKHICEPIEVSSICEPKFIVLERNQIHVDGAINKKSEIKEVKIVKLPNFELRANKAGVADAILFIFHSDERRTTGYKYFYREAEKRYACSQRSPRCNGRATLEVDEDGEKFIILGKTEHKCQPVKYEAQLFEQKIVNAPDFVTFSDNAIVTRIFVFTTPEHDQGYEFSYNITHKIYKCLGCALKNKYIDVKLCTNDTGEEYLKMSKQDHVCKPRKYIKEKYVQSKTISHDLFELHPNVKGDADGRLIIFISAKKEFVYEFCWIYGESYRCLECNSKNQCTIVKLLKKENGEKFVECSRKKHTCKPRKYDPKNY